MDEQNLYTVPSSPSGKDIPFILSFVDGKVTEEEFQAALDSNLLKQWMKMKGTNTPMIFGVMPEIIRALSKVMLGIDNKFDVTGMFNNAVEFVDDYIVLASENGLDPKIAGKHDFHDHEHINGLIKAGTPLYTDDELSEIQKYLKPAGYQDLLAALKAVSDEKLIQDEIKRIRKHDDGNAFTKALILYDIASRRMVSRCGNSSRSVRREFESELIKRIAGLQATVKMPQLPAEESTKIIKLNNMEKEKDNVISPEIQAKWKEQFEALGIGVGSRFRIDHLCSDNDREITAIDFEKGKMTFREYNHSAYHDGKPFDRSIDSFLNREIKFSDYHRLILIEKGNYKYKDVIVSGAEQALRDRVNDPSPHAVFTDEQVKALNRYTMLYDERNLKENLFTGLLDNMRYKGDFNVPDKWIDDARAELVELARGERRSSESVGVRY